MVYTDNLLHTATGSGLLLLCAVSAALGNSLQPISILAWLQLPLQLLLCEHLFFSSAPIPLGSAPATLGRTILNVMVTTASSVGLAAVHMLAATFAFTTLVGYPRPPVAALPQLLLLELSCPCRQLSS